MKLLFVLLAIASILYARKIKRTIIFTGQKTWYESPMHYRSKIELRTLRRQTFKLNVTLEVLKVLENLQAEMVVNKFVDNVYKPTSFRFSGDACPFLSDTFNKFILHMDEQKWKRFIHTCPVEKGVYYLSEVSQESIDASYLPLWKCKMDTTFYTNNYKDMLFNSSTFFEVVDV